MRPIWKGHITFGLVNVPVSLYPAEQRSDLQLHLIDSRNNSRVRYERVNTETGEEVPWDQIVKGYEYEDGNYVLVHSEDLERASPEAAKAVEIEAFVDPAEIDPMLYDKPYYLAPGKNGEKGYALLREAMRESGVVGVARVVIRTRQYIAVMAPREDALILTLLRYQSEIRPMDQIDLPAGADEAGVTKQEKKMARTLVDSMTRDWDPSEYHDEYREALMAWIEERIEAGEFERAPEAAESHEEAPAPINLMEALKKSVEHAGSRRSTRKPTNKPSRKKAG